MADARYTVFVAISTIVFFGTIYSILYDTYLDTSNPLLAHLPHRLSNSHYFASKGNFLNTVFIKKAWGWTSAAFMFSWVSSPQSTRTKDRLVKYSIETGIWLIFTSWFFGPALLERVIVASGELFVSTLSLPPEWSGTPRLRKGHDISGHIFLLTMSALFLADQLRPSFRARHWSMLHKWAVGTNIALIGIWLFASYTTSVYFHAPFEKFTGYVLGVASFVVTQSIDRFFQSPSRPQPSRPKKADD